MYRSNRDRPYAQGDPEMYEESRYGSEQRRSPNRYDRNSTHDHMASQFFDRTEDRSRGRYEDRAPQYDNRREYSVSPRPPKRRYNDRDREDYRSPQHDRSRSPEHSNPPNKTVVLEGLPVTATKEDIRNELKKTYGIDQLDDIRLIFDKITGQSRRFAFVEFSNLEAAKAFVEPNLPSIPFPVPNSNPAVNEDEILRVRLEYSRSRAERDERRKPGDSGEDWKCELCFLVNYSQRQFCHRCNGPRTRQIPVGMLGAPQQTSSYSGFAATGDSDVSPDGVASQYLLFRGLEASVSEEIFSRGVMKLFRGKNDTVAPPVTKKSKVRSTKASDATLGAKEGSLERILLIRDRKTNESWRFGFAEFSTIEDASAAIAKYEAMERFTIASKPVLVSFIHAGVFVPVLQAPAAEYQQFVFSPLHSPAINLMYWDEAGFAAILAMDKPKPTNLEAAKERLAHKMAAAAAKEGFAKDSDVKAKRRKLEKEGDTATSKKVIAPHLQFWSNRHAELHGIPAKKADNEPASDPQGSAEVDSTPQRSFADMKRKCCLLCSRQFKTDVEVHNHERGSQLHRDNMDKEDLVNKAIAKLEKAGIQQAPLQPQNAAEDVDSAAYRDRAKERRQAFNQPRQPSTKNREPVPASKEEEKPAQPSKGAALLSKMGWTAGSGLGAQGTGRTEAIATDIYAQGVGLGAQGGKVGDAIEEANRATNSSYSDFVNNAKEKAKARYQSMG